MAIVDPENGSHTAGADFLADLISTSDDRAGLDAHHRNGLRLDVHLAQGWEIEVHGVLAEIRAPISIQCVSATD